MKHKISAILLALPLLFFSTATFAAVENSGTETGSENITRLVITNESKVINTNTASANNDVDIQLSTGDNKLIGNTGLSGSNQNEALILDGQPASSNLELSRGGAITTGNIRVEIEVTNSLNENKTAINTEEEDVQGVGGGMGGGGAAPAADSASVGGLGGGTTPTTLPSAGSNTPLAAIPLTLGAIAALWSLLQIRNTRALNLAE